MTSSSSSTSPSSSTPPPPPTNLLSIDLNGSMVVLPSEVSPWN